MASQVAQSRPREARQDVGLTRRFVAAGVLLGVGLGGFLDGIVLHQVLQWHHMLSAEGSYPTNTVAGLERNTLWDGLFHALAWSATAAGLGLLWRSLLSGRPATSALIALLVIGWGTFSLLEGVVDHHILQVHHVRDDVADPLPWDLAFLSLGAALVAAGWLTLRRQARKVPSPEGG